MLCETNNIPQNIPRYFPHLVQTWEYPRILLESQIIVIDLNNVMCGFQFSTFMFLQ